MRLEYVASPTLDRFHDCEAFVRGVMGPVGSGKSVGMCWEIFMRACAQAPGKDGKRRTRWAIVRNTYGELLDTTLKTWLQWFPDGVFGSLDKTKFVFTLRVDDVEAEILFRALDRPEHIKKLLSLELTGAWINEAREVPKAILDGLTGRVGRFPAKSDGGPTWRGVFMDTNPSDDDHWWFRLAEEETPIGWRFFRQPGGLLKNKNGEWVPNPLAENIEHLDGGYEYYLRQKEGKSEEYIAAYLGGEYGVIGTGKPVYPEYNDQLHVSPVALKPIAGQPLILCWDFGLTPAAILIQKTSRGYVHVLREWCSEDSGITAFAADVVLPDLAQYDDWDIVSVGDPAGTQRAQTDARACMDILRELKIPTKPARTNAFTARRESVASVLTGLIDGRARFQLDPSCTRLRKGFLGRYFFQRVQVVGDERFKDEPAKNSYSHPHDALQYGCLELHADRIRDERRTRAHEHYAGRTYRAATAGGY
jgi:hypothetical protein